MIHIIFENKKASALLLAAILAVIISTAVFFVAGGDNFYLFLVLAVSLIWFFWRFRIFAKILEAYAWQNPVTEKIKKALQKLGSIISDFFSHVSKSFPRFSLPTRRKTNRLTLFSDEKMRMFSKKKHTPLRKMKWKALQNHRERIRFIYISFLQNKISKGAVVRPSDTPNELAVKLMPSEDKLFALYNTARYGVKNIEKEEVESVLHCAGKRLKI